ncbi:TrmH family RNA methyltransferase [Rubrobacter tropicus]|uniref:TrmH family RNA methyltransferase n=1 Tax=Rubrobacter tropicus TaxID=2653851 RepID=UPI00140CED91|nr:RNA methyltransferase [Rubrobacter tropicus]
MATWKRPRRTGKTASTWYEISPKRAAKLNAKKHREAERLFLAEGETLIRESPEPPVRTFESEAEVRRVSALKTPTGPVGVFPFLDVTVEELLSARDRIVLLHGVQDPGNVGTVIRGAHAFGAGVALSTGCADLYNPKTVRASMGSIFHAPVAREIDTVEFLNGADAAGFRTVAAVPDGGDAPGSSLDGKSVLVVGSEGSGLPLGVLERCLTRVSLPSQAASLNAAVAASILLYHAYARVLG